MSNALDVDMQDHDTIDEIRLVTELMVVASMAAGDLDQDVIDDALGLEHGTRRLPAHRRSG
ncbi:MAG: hypothetical protein ABI776_15550 [Nocardioidaceae bacterium]